MTDILAQAREYVASRGTTAQPRAYEMARALVELADKQPAAQPDMVQVPRDHVQTARALMDEAAAILGDLDHPAAEWRAPIVDELTGASLILAAAPQQPAAQPAEDPELSAALGWPGGIGSPVLDRQELLRMVAALRQQPTAQPVAWKAENPAVLQRLIDSICVFKGQACWDYMAMYDVRDALYAAQPVDPAEVMRLADEYARCVGTESAQKFEGHSDEARAALARAVGAKDE